MGNCTSRIKKKSEGNSVPDDKRGTDSKPSEDVTYASIDHTSVNSSRRPRPTTDDDCDYATVNVPAALQRESECSSKEECEDDYVLMG
ncbi:uncharacterized protein si:ch211-214p13.7 [Acanthopagrus latus]|uniref:uncharacterized protein si:ch211-214p13.7 n=1 Tax=Acanthopagrus latus TaxID=8177 RepID=UPI00187CD785|nr:uncharacterized protein si:ch211-214p13.7 [Acanthopagrus latus]